MQPFKRFFYIDCCILVNKGVGQEASPGEDVPWYENVQRCHFGMCLAGGWSDFITKADTVIGITLQLAYAVYWHHMHALAK